MAEVKEEWFVLVLLDEFDGFKIESVGEIFIFAEAILRQIEPADSLITKNVRPEVGSVADAFDLAADVPVKAVVTRSDFKLGVVMAITREVPLADHAGGVAVAL